MINLSNVARLAIVENLCFVLVGENFVLKIHIKIVLNINRKTRILAIGCALQSNFTSFIPSA